jgi:hypothetical protein
MAERLTPKLRHAPMLVCIVVVKQAGRVNDHGTHVLRMMLTGDHCVAKRLSDVSRRERPRQVPFLTIDDVLASTSSAAREESFGPPFPLRCLPPLVMSDSKTDEESEVQRRTIDNRYITSLVPLEL